MPRFKKNFLTLVSGITLGAIFLVHAGPGRAGEDGDTTIAGGSGPPQDAAAGSPVTAQGMRVYRDPQTGRLGPPPPGTPPLELSPAERRMLKRSDRGLQQRTLPGGGVAVDLQGRYRNMAVATVGKDGQAEVNCELTPAQAEAALQAKQPARTGSTD